MDKKARENAILDRLQGKKHLLPVFTSTLNIPERLQEYDESLFVVLNVPRQRYEVHSLSNKGSSTFCMMVSFDELDDRLLRAVRQGDLRNRGRSFFDELDRHNEKVEASAERTRKNNLMGVVEEMHPYFRDYAWH